MAEKRFFFAIFAFYASTRDNAPAVLENQKPDASNRLYKLFRENSLFIRGVATAQGYGYRKAVR